MSKKKIDFVDDCSFTYEGNHILVSSIKDYYMGQNHSKIETQEYFNITPDCLNKILSHYEILKSHEQRSNIRKNIWNSKTQEEKNTIASNISKGLNGRSQEEQGVTRVKKQLTWSTMEEDKFLNYKEKLSNSLLESWSSKDEEWLKEWKLNISKGWQGKSEEELLSIAQKKAVAMESKSEEELKFRSARISNAWNSKSEARKQQALDKKSRALKKSWKNRSEESIKNAVAKAHNTMRINGTFNSSVPEEKFYQKLLQYFDKNDIFTQYNEDSRYPFRCDFYIKSLDLFIELNLFFTHGPHPFDPSNKEDLKMMEELIQKTSKSELYKIALNVWTVSDPLKIKTAKENNLKYIILYSNKDIEKFFQYLDKKEYLFENLINKIKKD